VYETSPLATASTAGSQGGDVPPMHGTFMSTSWTTPSGVVSMNEPPEKAHTSSLSSAFRNVTR
jgi:hypothetical protein